MKCEGKTINKGADKIGKEVFSRNFNAEGIPKLLLDFHENVSGKFLKKCILPALKRLWHFNFVLVNLQQNILLTLTIKTKKLQNEVF